MFPYDGITRIRFLGYVLSPPNLASTLSFQSESRCKGSLFFAASQIYVEVFTICGLSERFWAAERKKTGLHLQVSAKFRTFAFPKKGL